MRVHLRRPSWLLALTASWMLARVWGEGVSLPAPLAPGVDEGEILLGELNCLACHAPTEAPRGRVSSRGAPYLGEAGLRLTPQWLRAWLMDPAALKPGTTMPGLMHQIDASKRVEAVEALTHFLVSVQPAGPAPAISADPTRAEKGRELYHSLGCVACHAPFERGAATEQAWAQAQQNAVPLGDLARKYPAGELARFLSDPVRHRPGGRMPSLGLTPSEAVDLSTYLLREQIAAANQAVVAAVPGLTWEYCEGDFDRCEKLESATAVASGVTEELTAKLTRRENSFGLRFNGLLEVPADGEYQFSTTSDDGSQIWIDGKLVVNNDREHGTATRKGTVTLTKGSHPFRVLFFQNGGGYEFSVAWQGPGIPLGPIPATAFRHQARPMEPLGAQPFVLDPTLVAKGKEYFTKLNCAACHGGINSPMQPAKALAQLSSASMQGCLADSVPGQAPRFSLSPSQRMALRKTVSSVAELEKPLTPSLTVAVTLSRLNCYACHSRDGVGGPVASGHADWFKIVGEADLGDEGRIPPLLTGVGAKLRPTWLSEVLHLGTKVRPYMATRMPRFGTNAVDALQVALVSVDRRPGVLKEPELSERNARFGWKLVGRDGLSCIACHTFTTYGSMGIPALSLDGMYRRLEWDWFRRYLPDPGALRPGTRMPSFWPDGHAANQSILGGDPAAQIQAIWTYLAGGAAAEVPSGLVRGRKEIVVDREPVIYRNFIEGAGSRAIAVGYPEHANVAFDAEQLRLALIWQGSFIDAARHSTDRGVGFEPPLGDHRVALPPGPSWAILPSADAAWPKASDQRFKGYRFNTVRQPVFDYTVGEIDVTDTIVPRPGELDMSLVRSFRLSGKPTSSLWFRAAVGKVERRADGTYLVDDKLRLRFTGGGEPLIQGKELRVPVTVPGELNVEMIW